MIILLIAAPESEVMVVLEYYANPITLKPNSTINWVPRRCYEREGVREPRKHKTQNQPTTTEAKPTANME